MGLREINAQRTRELIVTAAMELFFERGYEATTMEEVAAHAGVGSSTLYRYFPTKDQLGTALVGDPGVMAEELAARPAGEPPGAALGEAVLAFLRQAGEDPRRSEQFRHLVNDDPRLGVRLMEWLVTAHQQLAEALAVRRGLPADDLSCAASAWLAVLVLQRVDLAQASGDSRSTTDIAADVMATLAASEPVLPAP